MKTVTAMNRRHFLHTSVLASAALAAAPAGRLAAAADADADADRGLKLGIASYSLRMFSLDQAIAMTREAGVKYITLKDVHLPLKSTTAERKEAHRKIEAAGLVLMGGGVISMRNNEDGLVRIFEYAKDAGMPTIVCSPEPAALDTMEKLVKQYDIRIAIHNHGPTDKLYPSPLDALKLVQDRDARMGLCMDLGHTVRLGENAVEVIQRCGRRLLDFHIKDVNGATAKGRAVLIGKGIIDMTAVLKTLRAIKFAGHVALEHEINPDAPLPGIKESFVQLRKILATL